MNNVTILALEKLVATLKSKESLDVGNYSVDELITVHVKGTVKKFPDEVYTPTVSVPLKATMAVLLHLMGFQRERAAELLVKAMTTALNQDVEADTEIKSLLNHVDNAMAKVSEITSTLPPQTRTGKTTVTGEAKVVNSVSDPEVVNSLVATLLDKAI